MTDENTNVPQTTKDPSVSKIEKKNRLGKVWDLKVRGVSAQGIAKALDVSVDTIYRDLKEIGRKYRDQLLQTDAMTLVAENLQWLDEMERVALFEVHSAGKETKKVVDEQTGKVVEITVADPNKSKFYSSALKAREMKLKLMLDVGVIPKDEPEKLFEGLETYDQHEEELAREDRSPEEVRESIEKLLKHTRTM